MQGPTFRLMTGTVGNVCIEVELGLLTSKLVAIPIPIPIRTYEKIVER